MEASGITVDRNILARMSNDFATRMETLAQDILQLAGEDFNIASPKQLGEILFDKMGLQGGKKAKTGAYSTSADVLEDLAASGVEIASKVLDWRHLAKLKSTYAITIDGCTLGRWLKEHRQSLLAGTLGRPMLDDDGKPEAYADEIASILKAEPQASYERVHTELQRLYRVAVPHKRLRTYLDSLDRSTIASDAARRRSPHEHDLGGEWLLLNEERVYELLKTLGVCGCDKLQQTILEHCGITIALQPLRTFLDRAYGQGGRLHSIAIHDKAMKAVRDSAYDEEVARAKPVYAKLIKMFFDTPGTIGNLLSLLSKHFGISMSNFAAKRLLLRLQSVSYTHLTLPTKA